MTVLGMCFHGQLTAKQRDLLPLHRVKMEEEGWGEEETILIKPPLLPKIAGKNST